MDLMPKIDQDTQRALEAAAFRTLLAHLQKRSDVQNIDLMNLAGFCRNCLSRWYGEAAAELGIQMSKDETRERIYGMDYGEWKERYQEPTTEAQREAFQKVMADPDLTS